MLKIRRSHDRLIFKMGISIPGKDSLYIKTGPELSASSKFNSKKELSMLKQIRSI